MIRRIAATLLVSGVLIAAADVRALTYLSSVGQGSFGLIQDGTSNTVQFGEGAEAAFCFDAVSTPGGIQDGTSNTILFGEAGGLSIVPGGVFARAPIGQIADGTSNTIFLGETPSSFCLGDAAIGDPVAPGDIADGTSNTIVIGEGGRFDVCFRDVQIGIQDGTSNTIQFGELQAQRCYQDVRLAGDLTVTSPTGVPAPSSLALLLVGLAAIGRWRRTSLD